MGICTGLYPACVCGLSMLASAGGSPMSRNRSSEEQPPVNVAKATAELSAKRRDAFNMAMISLGAGARAVTGWGCVDIRRQPRRRSGHAHASWPNDGGANGLLRLHIEHVDEIALRPALECLAAHAEHDAGHFVS